MIDVFARCCTAALCFLFAVLCFIVLEVIDWVSNLEEKLDGIAASQVEVPSETKQAATED